MRFVNNNYWMVPQGLHLDIDYHCSLSFNSFNNFWITISLLKIDYHWLQQLVCTLEAQLRDLEWLESAVIIDVKRLKTEYESKSYPEQESTYWRAICLWHWSGPESRSKTCTNGKEWVIRAQWHWCGSGLAAPPSTVALHTSEQTTHQMFCSSVSAILFCWELLSYWLLFALLLIDAITAYKSVSDNQFSPSFASLLHSMIHTNVGTSDASDSTIA